MIDTVFDASVIDAITPLLAQCVVLGIGLGAIAWGMGYVIWVAIDLMRGGV